MKGETKVELNFPKDMHIIERKMAEVLANIISKRYGPEGSMRIAREVEKRLKDEM